MTGGVKGNGARGHGTTSPASSCPVMKDGFTTAPATFGGLVVRVDVDRGSAVAVAVLVDAATLALLETHTATRALEARADGLPAVLAAFQGLATKPDIAFVAGHGTADAMRDGIAMRFGIATGVPCIGVATAAPPGMHSRTNLHDMRGAFTPLRDGVDQVGWLLRSRVGAEPLVVSPGHKVAMPSAPELVMRCIRGDRLPEPLRLAIAQLP